MAFCALSSAKGMDIKMEEFIRLLDEHLIQILLERAGIFSIYIFSKRLHTPG